MENKNNDKRNNNDNNNNEKRVDINPNNPVKRTDKVEFASDMDTDATRRTNK